MYLETAFIVLMSKEVCDVSTSTYCLNEMNFFFKQLRDVFVCDNLIVDCLCYWDMAFLKVLLIVVIKKLSLKVSSFSFIQQRLEQSVQAWLNAIFHSV